MSEVLKNYFSKLMERVEASDEITNEGKDENGFYKPTRTVLLRNLQLLKDLHDKPLARPRVKETWKKVQEELPVDWLILDSEQKKELKEILKE